MKKLSLLIVVLSLLVGFKAYATVTPCCMVADDHAVIGVDIDPIIEDTTPPVIMISDYNTSPTNQDITVTATTNEGTLNENSHTFTENGSFDFIATDAAGNTTTLTVTITNIDKIAPIFGFLPVNLITPTNHDITVQVTMGNVNPEEIVTFNATSHTFTENGSFDFIATDAAGNVSTKTVTVTNIMKVSNEGKSGSYARRVINPVVAIAPVVPVGKVLGESTFKFTKYMKIGSKGNEVMELQKRLTTEGLYSGSIDGIFGKITKKSVVDFQVKNEIDPKGVVGPMTRMVLNK